MQAEGDSRFALEMLIKRLETQIQSWDRQLTRAATMIGFALAAPALVTAVWGASDVAPGLAGWLAIGTVVVAAVLTAGLALGAYQSGGGVSTLPEARVILARKHDPKAPDDWCDTLVNAIESNSTPLKDKAKLNRWAIRMFAFEFVATMAAFTVLLIRAT